jgi:hypothetical protein
MSLATIEQSTTNNGKTRVSDQWQRSMHSSCNVFIVVWHLSPLQFQLTIFNVELRSCVVVVGHGPPDVALELLTDDVTGTPCVASLSAGVVIRARDRRGGRVVGGSSAAAAADVASARRSGFDGRQRAIDGRFKCTNEVSARRVRVRVSIDASNERCMEIWHTKSTYRPIQKDWATRQSLTAD